MVPTSYTTLHQAITMKPRIFDKPLILTLLVLTIIGIMAALAYTSSMRSDYSDYGMAFLIFLSIVLVMIPILIATIGIFINNVYRKVKYLKLQK